MNLSIIISVASNIPTHIPAVAPMYDGSNIKLVMRE